MKQNFPKIFVLIWHKVNSNEMVETVA